MTKANKLTSVVLHMRMTADLLKPVKKLALDAGLPTATQARVLIREALKARKLIT
jgi:hypothetical protein